MNEIHYMQRALDLAKMGLGNVSPNPMVGCVIVYDDKIIGEGFHIKYGEAHAEVNAINSVKDKSLLPSSTVYVSLEPCSHFGKTPPCVDLLIKEKVAKVVICNSDPFHEVNGKGIEKLKNAGIKVQLNVLLPKGEWLNRRFFTSQEKIRPYIILKWAESADGYIADKNNKPVKISGDFAQIHSHKWRVEEDAIMVGSKTIQNDNPTLTVRHWSGNNPTRIILFPELDSRISYNVLDHSVKTIVFNNKENSIEGNLEFIKIQKNNLAQILEFLHDRRIQSLIVEGGSRLHQLFIDKDIFDEIRVFKSKKVVLNNGISSAQIPKNLIETENTDLKTDFLRIYSRQFQP
jgi:diaminohydroxyphosphoribosylaminopyrimidine deaminase/5-amino-6-(5-phosphoribosylamino)uracil reductase